MTGLTNASSLGWYYAQTETSPVIGPVSDKDLLTLAEGGTFQMSTMFRHEKRTANARAWLVLRASRVSV